MYPQILIDKGKIKQNLEAILNITKNKGGLTSLAIVTKGVCADPEIVKIICENPGVDYLADSRIKNIATYYEQAHKAGKKTMLLRIPMLSEIAEVISFVDLCQISEIETIHRLNQEAGSAAKVQDILLMIDMGDLREGIFFQDREKIHAAVEEILTMENINLKGIGVNLTCYGAIIPTADNLGAFVELGREIEERHNIKLDIISGGNSSSIHLIERNELPEGINNLRLGEAFLLGNDTASGNRKRRLCFKSGGSGASGETISSHWGSGSGCLWSETLLRGQGKNDESHHCRGETGCGFGKHDSPGS